MSPTVLIAHPPIVEGQACHAYWRSNDIETSRTATLAGRVLATVESLWCPSPPMRNQTAAAIVCALLCRLCTLSLRRSYTPVRSIGATPLRRTGMYAPIGIAARHGLSFQRSSRTPQGHRSPLSRHIVHLRIHRLISRPFESDPRRTLRYGFASIVATSRTRAKGFVHRCAAASPNHRLVATFGANVASPSPYAAVTRPSMSRHAFELRASVHVSSHRVPGRFARNWQVFVRSFSPFTSRAPLRYPPLRTALPTHSASSATRIHV